MNGFVDNNMHTPEQKILEQNKKYRINSDHICHFKQFSLIYKYTFSYACQIYQLIDYIVNIDYDIFRPANLENWEASLQLFAQKLETIENDGKNVIDKCIPKLRITEMGIELINSTKHLNTRKCLVEHMITKHDSIVQKFISEIEMVEQEFRQKVRLFFMGSFKTRDIFFFYIFIYVLLCGAVLIVHL